MKEVSMAEKWSSVVGGETKRQHVETSETGRWHLYRGRKGTSCSSLFFKNLFICSATPVQPVV